MTDAFLLRTASADTVSTCLHGLSDLSTYPKLWKYLKFRLELEDFRHISEHTYKFLFVNSVEHERKLDSVLASLSDAQFNRYVRILVCSPKERVQTYSEICAMIPQDLDKLQEAQADRLSEGFNLAAEELSPSAFQVLQQHAPTPRFEGILHSRSENSIHHTFIIDDVPGAADLLFRLVIAMKGPGPDAGSFSARIIELLHVFANLSRTLDQQLKSQWVDKWPPLARSGVEEFSAGCEESMWTRRLFSAY